MDPMRQVRHCARSRRSLLLVSLAARAYRTICCARRFGAPSKAESTPTSVGGVIKQRIARTGQGKSGGFRAIVLFRSQEWSFFVHGFAKSDTDNLRQDELKAMCDA